MLSNEKTKLLKSNGTGYNNNSSSDSSSSGFKASAVVEIGTDGSINTLPSPILRLRNNSVTGSNSRSSMISNWYDIFSLTKDQWMLFISVATLMVATALERVTFKMAVDRMTPFRFFLVDVIFVVSISVYSCINVIKRGFRLNEDTVNNMQSFSHKKLLIMAVLETIQFAGLVVSASGVSPTMTVILLHASTPCIVYGSRLLFPDRKYSSIQLKGANVISVAVIVSLSRPISDVVTLGIHDSNALSCILYALSAALIGFANLYKETCIIEWSKPIDIYYLSSWLFAYQCCIALLLSPAIYFLQNMTYHGDGFPLSSFITNSYDGFQCLLGRNPSRHAPYDTIYCDCEYSMWIVIGYVILNIVVIECINKVLQTSNQLLGRCLAASVLVAFVALGIYDTNVDYGYGFFGSNVGIVDIISIILLIYGLEVYGCDNEPDVEIITNY